MATEPTLPAPVLALLRLHRAIYVGTNGWLGHRLLVTPTLLLHTTGAKTGQSRSSALAYWRDDDTYVVAASNGGSDRHPAWYHNLRKQPRADVNVGRRRFAVTARILTPTDEEHARLWRLITEKNKTYDAYQKATTRPIPILVLTPS